MTWDIYIHTTGGHYKFWSVEKGFMNNRWVYTGQVKYGRIGSNGTTHFYGSHDTVSLKIREKINEGYGLFTSSHSDGIPRDNAVREYLGRDEAPTESAFSRAGIRADPIPTQEPTPVQRVNERISRTRTPIRKEYETTSTGNIKKYNFTRPNIAMDEDIIITHEYVRNIIGNQTKVNQFMTYFQGIPLEQRNNIREIGTPEQRGTIRDNAGETFVVFYSANRIVGVFSVNTRTGVSSVFYMKSTQTNKKQIIKHMLRRISAMVTTPTITIRNKPTVVKEEIETILGTRVTQNIPVAELKREFTGQDSNNIRRFVNKWQ